MSDAAPIVRVSEPTDGLRLGPLIDDLGLVRPTDLHDDRRDVPALWIGTMVHWESALWFRERATEVSPETNRRYAFALRPWITFLHLSLGKTVHEAAHADWVTFLRLNWLPSVRSLEDPGVEPECTDDQPGLTLMSDNQILDIERAVRMFHRWLSGAPYKRRFPFKVKRSATRRGTAERLAGGPRPKPTASRPSPVHPRFLQVFLDNAGDPSSETYERDMAFERFLAATGFRRGAATALTHYELPRRGDDLASLHSPRAITKFGHGYDSLAIPNLMHQVWIWTEDLRPGIAEIGRDGGHHRPVEPLRIVTADSEFVTVQHPSGAHQKVDWDRVTDVDRRRLVDVDGTSPFVWLTRLGTPAGYSTLSGVHTAAHARTRQVLPDFPSLFPPHSLRHTHALLTLFWWYFNQAPGFVVSTRDGQQIRLNVEQAMGMVQANMGHFDEKTTRHYTQSARAWLDNADPVTAEMIKGLR